MALETLTICPNFVIKLRGVQAAEEASADSSSRSESDVLAKLRLKMREYQGNGASLRWLMDNRNYLRLPLVFSVTSESNQQ